MAPKKHVKIVLPCYEEGEWLRATVDSILEHSASYPSFEVLVLANGDRVTDFSFIDQSEYCRQVRLQTFPQPLGVANCINEAVLPGDATYYAFLDAHCLLDQEDWLQRMVACLEKYPSASMVQPEVVQFACDREIQRGERLDARRMEASYRAYSLSWCWPYQQPEGVGAVHSQRLADTPWEAMAGGGMAVFTRAENFHRLGKYDPEVIGWFPETMDYCVHGWLLGYPMMVDPAVRVYHRMKLKRDAGLQGYDFTHVVHGILRTAYKYLSPRRRELAEALFRRHGLSRDVDRGLELIEKGRWLSERVQFLRERIRDDDWLFEKFAVREERFRVAD
jgi:GT2 family glycosyltransferase